MMKTLDAWMSMIFPGDWLRRSGFMNGLKRGESAANEL
jgi:hypothetical protein